MIKLALPRYVLAKRLRSGVHAMYFNVPKSLLANGCPKLNQPLGTQIDTAFLRAATLNGIIDEWQASRRGEVLSVRSGPRYGTVDWLFDQYRASNAYLRKVSRNSRRSYEWSMRTICGLTGKTGQRLGDFLVSEVTPALTDKLYNRFIETPRGERLRRGEKLVILCRKAWKVVHWLHPHAFRRDVPNPWVAVAMKRRVKAVKPAVSRADVYRFAQGCIEHGQPECAAAAVICFEFLQRPENVIAGHVNWPGYRPGGRATIRIVHHKTGAVVEHPLEERLPDGSTVYFYADAEAVLAGLERRGTPMILRSVGEGKAKPFSFSGMQKIVQRMRKEIGLPYHFTLDACRHGGLTELEEAELTDGQGRALSAHRTQLSYIGYAKRTEPRVLAATRKRYAHRRANQLATKIQNDPNSVIQNGSPDSA